MLSSGHLSCKIKINNYLKIGGIEIRQRRVEKTLVCVAGIDSYHVHHTRYEIRRKRNDKRLNGHESQTFKR